MVTYEAFADLVDEIAGSLPEAFFRDLNGGVNVKEECRIHPESLTMNSSFWESTVRILILDG